MRLSLLLASGAAGLLLAAAAEAHDFWISPSKFRIKKGDTVELALRDGVEYDGAIVMRSNRRIEKFVVLGPEGTVPVPGDNGSDPAGTFTPEKDGVYVVAYRSTRRSIELEAAKFEAYLREEGLEHVAKARAEHDSSTKAGREVYSRCAKSLLKVGDGASTGFDRVAGLRLEIVPETDPFAPAAPVEWSFRVVFEDKPLEGGLVVARNRNDQKRAISARTGADGRVKLALARPGEWLVKCTHMVAAPTETGMDWESLWASVTFEVESRAGSDVAPTARATPSK